MTRLRHQFEPQHIKRIEQYNLEHEIEGGILDQERVGYFSLVFRSEGEAHAYLGLFGELLPALCRALMISYRYPMLTDRKKEILLWRVQGKPPKEIAQELGISPRTVKMHLEGVRRKLYADDLVQAAWIAGHIGLIG
jgi:DNA-binding CsgD family transcriptional regulator